MYLFRLSGTLKMGFVKTVTCHPHFVFGYWLSICCSGWLQTYRPPVLRFSAVQHVDDLSAVVWSWQHHDQGQEIKNCRILSPDVYYVIVHATISMPCIVKWNHTKKIKLQNVSKLTKNNGMSFATLYMYKQRRTNTSNTFCWARGSA